MKKLDRLGTRLAVSLLLTSVLGAACATDQRDPGVLGAGGQVTALPEAGAGGSGAGEMTGGGRPGLPDLGGAGGSGGSMLVEVNSGPCEDGAARECGTSEGECEFGTQTCVGQAWGDCVGDIAPRVRDCASPLDNDCDGQLDNLSDEACSCVPGEVDAACGEHPELFGQGLCAPGTRECQVSADGTGSVWSACLGEVGPSAAQDRCETPNDDNCDGTLNGGCTCVVGVAGSCANPEPADCSVQCVRDGSDSSTRCVVAALDRDRDGSSSCAAAPTAGGLDCDDQNPDVHPGALESCDGVDNDCDDNSDLGNELAVAGLELRLTEAPEADVAFSPSDGHFRFAAQSAFDNGITFGLVNRNNAFGLVSVEAMGSQNPNFLPRIAQFNDEFALVYTQPARVDPEFNPQTRFARVSPDGTVLATTPIASGSSDVSVAVTSTGDWITAMSRVSREAPEVLELGRIDDTDSYTPAANGPEVDLGAPHLALIGGSGVAVWQTAYSGNFGDRVPASVQYARFDADLHITGAITEAAPRGTHPDITAIGSAYFIAWAIGGGVQYAVVGSNGQLQCSDGSSFGNGVLDNEDAVAVEGTENGVVLLATDAGGGDVGVFVYDQACQELEHALIPPSGATPTPRRPELPSLAQGGGDLLFAWTEGGTDSVFRRTTLRICE